MRLPHGFLGTRADVLMDIILIAMLATPFVIGWAIRMARRLAYRQHRNLQTALLCVLWTAVVLFEADVRMSGGSKAYLAGSAMAGTRTFTGLLVVHIAVAVISFALWTWVVARAWRGRLPPTPELVGPYHRRMGYAIWAGVTFTSASGAVLYWWSFVS